MIEIDLPKRRPQITTLDEVAARAGVSRGTASRVLNGKNKENRPAIARRSELIRKIALELGYRPNAAARSMFRGSFRAVAFVTCGDPGTDWYSIPGLNGIHTELNAANYRLIFSELPANQIADPDIVPNLFRETSVDGMVINLLPFFSEDLVEYFEAQPIPCVWFNLKRKKRSIYPDEKHGASMAVKKLIDLGHHKIGYFSKPFPKYMHYSAVDRLSGFHEAMKKYNLPGHRFMPQNPGGENVAPDVELALEFLRNYPDVEGVVCREFEESINLMVAAERLGRKVPRDLQIVGFSEQHMQATYGVDIMTALIPFHEVGKQSVKMLNQCLETGNYDVNSIAVPYSTIIT